MSPNTAESKRHAGNSTAFLIYLLSCYDVWSASRSCGAGPESAGRAAAASEQP